MNNLNIQKGKLYMKDLCPTRNFTMPDMSSSKKIVLGCVQKYVFYYIFTIYLYFDVIPKM